MEVFVYVLIFAVTEAVVLQPLIAKASADISMVTLEKRAVNCDNIKTNYFQWALAPAADNVSPNGLERRGQIFQMVPGMVEATSFPIARLNESTATSLETASQKIALDMNIGASYMAFSGAANLELTKTSSQLHATIRRDRKLRAYQCELQAISTFFVQPETYISPGFTYSLENFSPSKIADTYGAFYAKKIYFGGQFKQTWIMERTEKEDGTDFTAEIEATYGKGPVKVDGGFGSSATKRKTLKVGKIQRQTSWMGGDTSTLLSPPVDENDRRGNAAWAKTFDASNVFDIRYELGPIWDIVSAVNVTLGLAVQTEFKKRWVSAFNDLNRQINSLPPLKFDPLVVDHPKRRKAKSMAQSKIDNCKYKVSDAQSWISTWYAQFDLKRNENWKSAAKNCIEKMYAIRKKLDDPKETVFNFKIWLHNKAVEDDYSGMKCWGINCNDSVKWNEVYKDVAATERDILILFN